MCLSSMSSELSSECFARFLSESVMLSVNECILRFYSPCMASKCQ